MRELASETLIVFLSDCHIGGDPGCEIFEAAPELEALLEDLANYEGPVELILAGDFLDLLLIGDPPQRTDRARAILEQSEYQELFEALRGFASKDKNRVVYLPGNHDAELWWNPQLRRTLTEAGLVSEFSLSYLASLGKPGQKRFTIYCEHGDQFDPTNRIEDYSSPLCTPLGHYIVRDFERRIARSGKVARNLDLSEMRHVRPLSAIPQWVASKYFYNALGWVTAHLMIPFILLYMFYRGLASYSALSDDLPRVFYKTYLLLPRIDAAIEDVLFFIFITLLLFGVLVVLLRHSLRGFVATMYALSPAAEEKLSQKEKIEAMLGSGARPPLLLEEAPEIDVFVSGHTHTPGIKILKCRDGTEVVVANSGCWQRKLSPVRARLKSPPVFVPKFTLTHLRVFLQGARLRVELWEHPKPAVVLLTRLERLLARGRIPHQPASHAKPRLVAAAETFPQGCQ